MFGALSSLRRAASQTAARASARAASARRFATSTGPLAAYNDLLLKHPILTKSVTSMCVVGGGDWVAQKFIEGRDAIVWKRVATMGLVGLTLVGPTLHHWFGFLFRVLPGTGAKATIQKTLVDQLLFAPIFNPLFVGYLYLLEGESRGRGPAKRSQAFRGARRCLCLRLHGCNDEHYLLAVRNCRDADCHVTNNVTAEHPHLALPALSTPLATANARSQRLIHIAHFLLLLCCCFSCEWLPGRSDQIVDFLKNDWFSVTVSNWKLWGPAQAINFMFVPARFQVLCANCTAVAWNCFLSWKSHRNEAHEPPAEVAAE